MTAADPTDLRARFLAAIGAAGNDVDAPQRLCRACLAVLPVQRVSITICATDGVHELLGASDEIAERMEWAQLTLGEGPGLDAVAPIVVHDVAAAASPWPLFAKEAAAAGVGLMCALPLQLGAIRVGVLSLYLPVQAEFGPQDFDDAIVIADLVTSTLISGGGTSLLDPLDHWWEQPQAAREIHQATGMLVAQLGVGAREAYVRMRAYSFAHGRLLGDVARDIVHGGLRIGDDPDFCG